MSHEPAWADLFRRYPCPSCHAMPGEPCQTRDGNPTRPHLKRRRLGDRCPVCGVLVGNDDEPGTLCARCSLVRSLEVERATTYRRGE